MNNRKLNSHQMTAKKTISVGIGDTFGPSGGAFSYGFTEPNEDFMSYSPPPPNNDNHYIKMSDGQLFGPVTFLKSGISLKSIRYKDGMVIMELNNMADIFYVALSSETELAYKVKHAKFDDMDEDTKDLVKYFGPKYPDLTMGFLEASIFKVSDSINSLLDTEPELFHKQAPEDCGNLLIWAASIGAKVLVALLTRKGVPLNERDKEGKTALHYACESEDPDVAIFLLDKGADPDVTDNSGEKPKNAKAMLHCLKMGNSIKVAIKGKKRDITAKANGGIKQEAKEDSKLMNGTSECSWF